MSLYFCQVEDVDTFRPRGDDPGPSTEFFGEIAREYGIVLVIFLF